VAADGLEELARQDDRELKLGWTVRAGIAINSQCRVTQGMTFSVKTRIFVGMQKKHRVNLTDAQRQKLQTVIASSRGPARRAAHARILLKADESAAGPGWDDATSPDDKKVVIYVPYNIEVTVNRDLSDYEFTLIGMADKVFAKPRIVTKEGVSTVKMWDFNSDGLLIGIRK
jgi:hypothetical protein